MVAWYGSLSDRYRRLNLSMAALRGGMMALIGVIAGLGTLVVLFVGGAFVISGRLDLGDFVAFNAYLGLLVWPTIALGWIINTLQRGAGAIERIGEVLDEEPEIPVVRDTEICGIVSSLDICEAIASGRLKPTGE